MNVAHSLFSGGDFAMQPQHAKEQVERLTSSSPTVTQAEDILVTKCHIFYFVNVSFAVVGLMHHRNAPLHRQI